MSSLRIKHSFLDWATNFFAFVFFASLDLVADFFALELLNLCYFFLSHCSESDEIWIVELVARYFSSVFAASAVLLHQLFAPLTIVIMTLNPALMSNAG